MKSKKKIIIAIVLAVVLVAVIAVVLFVASRTKLEESRFGDTEFSDLLELTIDGGNKLDKDFESFSFSVENPFDSVVEYKDNGYYIEKLVDGEWKEVVKYNIGSSLSIMTRIYPDEVFTQEVSRDEFKYLFGKGKYRLIFEIRSTPKSGTIFLCEEFELV